MRAVHRGIIVMLAVLTMMLTTSGGSNAFAASKNARVFYYTGDNEIDYMVEDMVKKAGVKQSMTDQQIVRKIYKYISKHFVAFNIPKIQAKRYKGTFKRKNYYNLTALQGKIAAFAKKTEKRTAAGKVVIDSSLRSVWDSDWFAKRMGLSCDTMSDFFNIFCMHAGVKSGIAIGTAGGSIHSWNWVKIGKKKYFCDTWLGCSSYIDNKKVNTTYCLMTKKKQKKIGYKLQSVEKRPEKTYRVIRK